MKITKQKLKEMIKEEIANIREEGGAKLINKIVSRDGKKKGVKVSGTWKASSIKAKWLGKEGKFGETVDVDAKDYERKEW